MQFCSLNEAWGNDSKISDNYYQNNQNKLKEHFSPLTPDYNNSNNNNSNKKNSKITKLSCEQVITHALKCPHCSKIIKQKLYGSLYSTIRNSVEEYREPLVLVLTTIFIILIINLIIKID